MAVLFNDLQLSYAPTRRILAAIGTELQMGTIEFVEAGLF